MESGRPAKLEEYQDPAVARAYHRRWRGRRGQRRDRRKSRALDRALSLLGPEIEGGLLLDIPCGTGRFTAQLSASFSYLGFDLSQAMLAEARPLRRPERTGGLGIADLAALPLADASVEVAVCIRFLHLVREPELRIAFLRELGRVSRRGVVVDYRHGRTIRVWGRRLRHRLGLRERAPSNPSHGAIREELHAANLHPIHWIDVHFAPLMSDKTLIVARSPSR